MTILGLPLSRKSNAASRGSLLLKWLSCLLLIAGTHPSWAIFTVKSNGVVTTLATGSLTLGTAAGVVVDFQGNVYLTDRTNSQIVEIPSNGGAASVLSITGLSPGLDAPSGLAIDSSGNLYIADTGNSRIVKVTTSGSGSVISTPTITLNAPQGVAVDISGNVYISNTGSNQIVEVPSGGGNASADLTGSLANPRGIAVDPLGNLYVADTGNSRVIKVNATSPFSSGSINATVTTAAGVALDGPNGVFIGNNGVLYIADTDTIEDGHSTPGRVVIVDSQGNASELLAGYPVFDSPLALAVDAMGNLYVVDSGATANTGRVESFQSYSVDTASSSNSAYTTSVAFGHVTLGSAGTSISIPISVSEDTTLSSINIYTSGTQNLDFTIDNSSTCTSGANDADCTVTVTFAPTAAGLRKGALVLSYTSLDFPPGSLTIPIFGVADAPVAALSPGVASVFNVGSATISDPFQEAVDGAGNVYVTSYSSNQVIAIPAGGGSGTTVNTGSFTPSQPTGVAADASGNLFIADYGNARIIKVATTGTASLFTISGLSTGISFPTALAFDGAGNLYITDYGNGRIVEVNPYGQGTVLATGSFTFSSINITGTAVDAIGDVYIADRNNNRIVKVDPSGNATLLSLPSLTLSDPQGVAVDPSGNVYVMDSGHERIIQVTTSGAVSVMAFSGVTIGPTIFGITPDAHGNILVGDWNNGRLVKINVGQPALTFRDTNTHASSATQTATVTNLGDQPLVFSANSIFPTDFTADTSDENPCISGTSLSSGTSCDVPIVFRPLTAGSLSETVTVTDNTLNAANSIQQIAVSGTGINSGDTTSAAISISPTSAVYGQAVNITVRVSDTATGMSSTIPTGSVTFTDTVGTTVTQLNNGAAVTLNAAGQAVLTNVILGIGSHTITAQYGGVNSTFLATSSNASVAVTQSSVTVTGPSSAVTVLTGRAGSVLVTITGAYTGASTPSGSISYSILNSANTSVSSGSATLTAGTNAATSSIPIPGTLPAGTYTIHITYAGDANYAASTGVTITFTVGEIGTSVALTASPNPVTAQGAVTFTASVTASTTSGSANVTPTGTMNFYDGSTLLATVTVAANGQASYTTSSLSGGSHSITAVYSGDTNFSGATSAAVALTVQQSTSTTQLVSSANPVLITSAVSFTATVTTSSGSPTGTVGFYDGTTLLGTVTLSSGQAVYTTSSLAAGTHSITAAYSGNAVFKGSTSAAVAQLVQDFTISTPTSGTTNTPSATVAPGGTATYKLNIGPSVGTVFPAPVTLSLSGLPPGATGTLSLSTLPAGSSLTAVTLTIQLPQTTGSLRRSFGWVTPALGLILLPFAGRMRRSGKTLQKCGLILLLLVAGAVSAAGIMGCGAKDSGYFGQAQQTYKVVITATSGSVSHSTSVILTVQ
jgi:sugar lactone lactonase YvrE